MEMTSLIADQLNREAELTRRALQQVPKGKNDWKPHPKSMPLGQLAHLVATMPSWISMIVKQDELDIKPQAGGHDAASRNLDSAEALVQTHDKAVTEAKEAVSSTTDKKLQTPWKLLEGGKVMSTDSRLAFIMDNFKHLAHHRGQLTVYLRMNDAQVPAIYGPSADDHRF